MGDRAKELADYIDALDGRVFGGVLLIGGLVAIFNPIAGAAIAAKSLIPSLGILASKYGLRVAEDSLNQADMKRRAKQAEQEVLTQFQGSQTTRHVNEVLTLFERALRTTEDDMDPMLELHALLLSDIQHEQRRLMGLAASAVLDVFDSAMSSPREATQAGLGPEDVRFLQVLKTIAGSATGEPLK